MSKGDGGRRMIDELREVDGQREEEERRRRRRRKKKVVLREGTKGRRRIESKRKLYSVS